MIQRQAGKATLVHFSVHLLLLLLVLLAVTSWTIGSCEPEPTTSRRQEAKRASREYRTIFWDSGLPRSPAETYESLRRLQQYYARKQDHKSVARRKSITILLEHNTNSATCQPEAALLLGDSWYQYSTNRFHQNIANYLKQCRQQMFEPCKPFIIAQTQQAAEFIERSPNLRALVRFKDMIAGEVKLPEGRRIRHLKGLLLSIMADLLGRDLYRWMSRADFEVAYTQTLGYVCQRIVDKFKFFHAMGVFFTSKKLIKQFNNRVLDWYKAYYVCKQMVEPRQARTISRLYRRMAGQPCRCLTVSGCYSCGRS